MKRWILKHLGVLKSVNEAELEIIEKCEKISLSGDIRDEITEIVMNALSKIRR